MESEGDWQSFRHATVQCNLPNAKPSTGGRAPHGTDQVLWIQKTVFHRGRFVTVRELGCQTDPPGSAEAQSELQAPLKCYPSFPSTAASESSTVAPISSAGVDSLPSAPSSREQASMSRESRGNKRTPRTSRPVTSNNLSPAEEERAAEEIQQHVFALTRGSLDRACALQGHVEELNKIASAALICSRQFQSDFNPMHAFECGSRRSKRSGGDQSGDQWSSRSSAQRQASRESSKAGKSNVLPGLGGRWAGKAAKLQASTKLPWQELQGILSGCPDASLGSKVLLTGVEPWQPDTFTELAPAGSSLHERLTASAAVYLPFERPRKERKQKPPKAWVS